LIVILKDANFIATRHAFFILNLSDGGFSIQRYRKHILVSRESSLMRIFFELLLSLVVCNVVLVPLSVELMRLRGHILFSMLLFNPSLFEHVLLLTNLVRFSLAIDLTGVFLPVTDSHSFSYSFCFVCSLGDLTFMLFLGI